LRIDVDSSAIVAIAKIIGYIGKQFAIICKCTRFLKGRWLQQSQTVMAELMFRR